MSKPLISFCLPTYNRVAWIGECITSLLDQKEKNIEVVVVDDGSNDGTRDLLEWYLKSDSRVVVIYSEKNQGAGLSRNIATKEAKADIIAICDSDDFYPSDRADMILSWFKDNPKSEMVNYPYMRVGYFGEHLEAFWGSQFDEKAFKEKGTVGYFSNPTAAVKKDSLIEVGGYPSETKDKTDDVQLVDKWIKSGKKIDFDKRAFGCLHRVMPDSMMAKHRGWSPEWVKK